jgi:hypothetical protein
LRLQRRPEKTDPIMHQVPEKMGSLESANGSVARGQRAYTFKRYGHHVGLDKKCLLMEAYTFKRYGHHVGLDKKCLLMEDKSFDSRQLFYRGNPLLRTQAF